MSSFLKENTLLSYLATTFPFPITLIISRFSPSSDKRPWQPPCGGCTTDNLPRWTFHAKWIYCQPYLTLLPLTLNCFVSSRCTPRRLRKKNNQFLPDSFHNRIRYVTGPLVINLFIVSRSLSEGHVWERRLIVHS